MGRVTSRRPVLRIQDGNATRRPDALAVEEPMEIRLNGRPLTVTMRTPGDDAHLALGFLFAEGIIALAADVGTIVHCGRPGENGPIRMWLYPNIGPSGTPGPNGSGPHDGVLNSGTFSPTGVVCPASAVGTDMPLLAAMRAGLTYVNVHTNDGITPTNTGPGDFPGGEIRGQLGPRP